MDIGLRLLQNDKILRWPKKEAEKLFVLEHIVKNIPSESILTEKQINEIIKDSILFDDYVLVRRELVERQFIERTPDCREYKRKNKINVSLTKATLDDAQEIYDMQIITFAPLLKKYEDYDTNPGAEKLEKTIARLEDLMTDYLLIQYNNKNVGAVRIRKLEEGNLYKVGPLFIIPKYQNRGIAQNVFRIIEDTYKPKAGWVLDTILQEAGNCHLYEKVGYIRTGQVDKVNDKMDLVYYEKKKSICIN
jgi:N-acetylglutamate synthase-like GNAT family acetyltransferase